jgi:hypothetical protein
MIELVFAIVIIAISVISLPMMIQTTSKGIENNIVQEAIFAAESILNEATTFYWDLHSIDDANVSGGYARVVNTGDCVAGSPNRRSGQINRQCLNDLTVSPANVFSNDSLEYITHVYNNTSIFETGAAGVGAATYKKSYNATATVINCGAGGCVYFGESTDTNSTKDDIKQISITITESGSTTPVVLLRAYSTNIGEVKPESRIF